PEAQARRANPSMAPGCRPGRRSKSTPEAQARRAIPSMAPGGSPGRRSKSSDTIRRTQHILHIRHIHHILLRFSVISRPKPNHMNRIDRLFNILTLLQSKKYVPAEKIAERFKLSTRTVYRDIKALGESGIPISFEPQRGYFIVQGYFLPPVAFS